MPRLAPLPVWSPLARGMRQAQAVGGEHDVLVGDRDEFRAPQRAGVADQQQGAVAAANRGGFAGLDEADQFVSHQRRGLLLRPGMFALDATQRVADRRMRPRPVEPGQPMRPAQRRQPALENTAGVGSGEGGEVGGDGLRRGRQRRPASLAAPGEKMVPICPVGAQGSGREGSGGKIHCRGQAARAAGEPSGTAPSAGPLSRAPALASDVHQTGWFGLAVAALAARRGGSKSSMSGKNPLWWNCLAPIAAKLQGS